METSSSKPKNIFTILEHLNFKKSKKVNCIAEWNNNYEGDCV